MAATDFLSCDWGTTSFRLRWVAGNERRIVREIREKSGIKAMLERASIGASSRAEVFSSFLANKLRELPGNDAPPERPLPLVISGMASSSVGWQELPYAPVPFAINGSNLVSHQLDWNSPPWVGPTHLISGVATGNDMMRGEECEVIGLMSLPRLTPYREKCLLILPGTHSKHVSIENSTIVDWRTFMTGELFEVLGNHSLLRASLDLAARQREEPRFEVHAPAFVEGVRMACEQGISASLFKVRTHAVLHGVSAAENTAFFSGLLIGAELSEATKTESVPVLLAGTGAAALSYARAMELVFPASAQWAPLAPGQVEQATIAAHALFLERNARR
jgi:2-dehydro-3-deoxygalactonokinase